MKGTVIGIIMVPFLLIGCGIQVSNVRKIDNEFIEYVEKFEEMFGQEVYYSVQFSNDLTKTQAGICTMWGPAGYQSLKVLIDPVTWNKLGDSGREQLIFHELGHCSNSRLKHDDTRLPNGCPASVMFSVAFGDGFCYKDFKEYYYNQLWEAL